MYKTEKIIDANTIVVRPNWRFGSFTGNTVRILGYIPVYSKEVTKNNNDADIKKMAEKMAKKRLEVLLLDKFIELKIRPTETGECVNETGAMKCLVYLNNIEISKYFPDFENE